MRGGGYNVSVDWEKGRDIEREEYGFILCMTLCLCWLASQEPFNRYIQEHMSCAPGVHSTCTCIYHSSVDQRAYQRRCETEY